MNRCIVEVYIINENYWIKLFRHQKSIDQDKLCKLVCIKKEEQSVGERSELLDSFLKTVKEDDLMESKRFVYLGFSRSSRKRISENEILKLIEDTNTHHTLGVCDKCWDLIENLDPLYQLEIPTCKLLYCAKLRVIKNNLEIWSLYNLLVPLMHLEGEFRRE